MVYTSEQKSRFVLEPFELHKTDEDFTLSNKSDCMKICQNGKVKRHQIEM